MVELMIAITISLVLLAGVIQIFISSKQAYRATDGYGRLQENGRYAIDYLGKYIRLSGHRSSDNVLWQDDATVFPQTSVTFSGTIVNANAGQVVFGLDGNSGATDTIFFRFLPDRDALIDDCNSRFSVDGAGTSINVNNVVDFWVRFQIDASGELECRQIATVDNSGAITTEDDTETLVEDIDNMQILYGVDNDGDLIANRYVNATGVTAAVDWNNVVSVRIALLLRTPQNVDVATRTQTFQLNDQTDTRSDLRRRKRFVTTINLRNQTS